MTESRVKKTLLNARVNGLELDLLKVLLEFDKIMETLTLKKMSY